MVYQSSLNFNPEKPSVMHIDLNSCFATIEQQANPLLRGRPLVVAAYPTPSGCVLASSVEAKKYGIKTGMRVKDAKGLLPGVLVLSPDPEKYRSVHLSLRRLLAAYTNEFYPRSIDEFVLNLKGYPAFEKGMHSLAREIKERIRKEIGEYLTVSIGISTNGNLAKLASNLNKPDGLDEINAGNFLDVYRKVKLTDFCGIAERNAARLNLVGVYDAVDFYQADLKTLKAAFSSISAYYWYLRLRGWEVDGVGGRKSFGNSYALPKSTENLSTLSPLLARLVEKTSVRLRRAGLKAFGVNVSLTLEGGLFWTKSEKVSKELFDSRDIYQEALRLLKKKPGGKVRVLAESCFDLKEANKLQLELFRDKEKQKRLVLAQDEINRLWGEATLFSARSLPEKRAIEDRIAFGGVNELEERIFT